MRFRFYQKKTVKPFANSGKTNQTNNSVVSDLGLHCLIITLLGVFRLKWFYLLESSTTAADDILKLLIFFSKKRGLKFHLNRQKTIRMNFLALFSL